MISPRLSSDPDQISLKSELTPQGTRRNLFGWVIAAVAGFFGLSLGGGAAGRLRNRAGAQAPGTLVGPSRANREFARVMVNVSQETLTEMIGTTRSRVSFFMDKFRKLGFIEYNGGLHVHSSLLTVVLHD